MILQKLAQAIRRQDWFQVLIEVLIVIVGIFAGLQVQAWYEAQGDRELEAKYLAQLHDEVSSVEGRFIGLISRIANRRDILQGVLDGYRQDEAFSEFNDAECNAIIVSHVNVNFISPITTINELETTGRSLVIESEEIKRLMILHKNLEAFSEKFISSLQRAGIDFTAKFPELMDVNTLVTTSSGIPLDAEVGNRCQLPTEDKKIDFKNSLIFNTGRYTSYYGQINKQFKGVLSLHRALDEELGITHEGTGF